MLAVASVAVRAEGYTTGQIPNVQLADRTRFTSNPDGVLGAAAVATIDSLCFDLRERGIAEVAVVAVRSTETMFSTSPTASSRIGALAAVMTTALAYCLSRNGTRYVS